MNRQEGLKQAALDYHEFPTPGKLSITPTKQLTNQSDLALAYSPGVAAACEAIVEDPANAFRYTSRGNLCTCNVTSPEPPGSSGVLGVPVVAEIVAAFNVPVLADACPEPCEVKYA